MSYDVIKRIPRQGAYVVVDTFKLKRDAEAEVAKNPNLEVRPSGKNRKSATTK